MFSFFQRRMLDKLISENFSHYFEKQRKEKQYIFECKDVSIRHVIRQSLPFRYVYFDSNAFLELVPSIHANLKVVDIPVLGALRSFYSYYKSTYQLPDKCKFIDSESNLNILKTYFEVLSRSKEIIYFFPIFPLE